MNKEIKEFFIKRKPYYKITVFVFLLLLNDLVIILFATFCVFPSPEGINNGKQVKIEELERKEDAGYSYRNNLTIENLSIDFLDKPELVDKTFDLFTPSPDGKDADESLSKVYKTGVVTAGNIVKGDDIVGYTSYLLMYEEYYYEVTYVRILHNDSSNITYYMSSSGTYNFSSPVESADLKATVHMASLKGFGDDVFRFGGLPSLSVNNLEYDTLSFTFELIDESELKKVDKLGEHDLYAKIVDDGSVYLKEKDGTYSSLSYVPPIGRKLEYQNGGVEIFFTTNDGKKLVYNYRYFPTKDCRRKGITFSNDPIPSFEKIGSLLDGKPVYQKKDRMDSTLIDGYKNILFQVPYSYSRYEKSYPVIYIETPIGRMVELRREDFISDRVCF